MILLHVHDLVYSTNKDFEQKLPASVMIMTRQLVSGVGPEMVAPLKTARRGRLLMMMLTRVSYLTGSGRDSLVSYPECPQYSVTLR